MKIIKFPRFPRFRFGPIPQIENSEISDFLCHCSFLVVYETQDPKMKRFKTKKLCILIRINVNFRGLRVFDLAP